MTTPAAQRPEDERLGIGPNVVYGLQHVLTMYGGMVATPLILGQIAGLTPSEIGLLIAATLFTGGLATLLQTIGLPFFGCRLPLVQGVSFAGVATMGAILTSGSGGMPAVLGAVMAASLFGLLITPIFSQITPVDTKVLGNGLRADMLSSLIAPVFGSFTQSAFAQNVGLVAVTGIKSRFVVATGGVFLVVLGLLPIMGRVIAAIPPPVLGGAGLVLFGTVAASGIRTLSKVDYRNNLNLLIVCASLGFGMIPIAAPNFYEPFPDWFATIFHSGISSAAILAILMNLAFNHWLKSRTDDQSVIVAASEHTLRVRDIAALREGDYFQGGKLYSALGRHWRALLTPALPSPRQRSPRSGGSAPRYARTRRRTAPAPLAPALPDTGSAGH